MRTRTVLVVACGGALAGLVLALVAGRPPTELPLAELEERTGALVAVSSDRTLTLVDVDGRTRRSRRLPELAPGDPPLRLVRRGDRLVFHGTAAAGSRAPHVVGLAPAARPRALAEAVLFLPSADGERIWLARAAADGLEVAESALDGDLTVPWTPLPYESPVAALASGLVLQDEEGRLLVWDPRTRAPVMRLAGTFPLAAEGDVLAWCERECRDVRVTHVTAGLEDVLELPEGARAHPYAGSFAPGRRFLAVPVLHGPDPDGPAAVLVVELKTGERRLVADGIRPAPAKLGWTPDGGRLFFFAPGRGLLTYRPWQREPRRVAVSPSGPVYGFAVLERAGP